MAKSKSNKKIPEFEFSFNDISFCNESSLKPFMETFVQEPENINQQNLGTIFGIFEISDNSEDSSYIANYLISVIKKEYFSKPKRGPIESFEAALHKANLALAKLAEHGNINWIGKINVICAVLEKYNLHLTRIGACHALLLRDKNLTNISEDLYSEAEDSNPLKVFTEVSSGRMQENDKVIISTDNIFDIFSFEEIKKSANKFPEDNFVRFLKTALINELEKVSVLIIDIKKKEIEKVVPAQHKELNAFSSLSFSRASRTESETGQLREEIKEELEKSKKEMGNQQPGHIYIKESEGLPKEKSSFVSEFYLDIKNYFSDTFSALKQKTVDTYSSFSIRNKLSALRPNYSSLKIFLSQCLLALKYVGEKIVYILGKLALFLAFLGKQFLLLLKKLIPKDSDSFVKPTSTESSISEIASPSREKPGLSFLPDFKKIKEIFSKFTYEQKLYAVVILLLIFVVPYIGVKIERGIAERNARIAAQNAQPEIIPLEQDKNVNRISNLNEVAQTEDTILKIINLNGKIFAVSSSAIFDLEKNLSVHFPSEFQQIFKTFSGMDDLNLILFITENGTAFSFSPISGKFQSNSIEIPSNRNISASGTYLTYFYLLDNQTNQIYRYPRAEGGFGVKSDWLKDNLDLSTISDLDINENIFAVQPDKIIKLFKGKQQDFSVEQTATPIVYNKVYVSKNSSDIYIFDKVNSRIIKLNQEGNILNQFYNEKLKDANSFSVNEENGVIYFSVDKKIYSFSE